MRESEGEQGRYKAGNIHTNDKYREKKYRKDENERERKREKGREKEGEQGRYIQIDIECVTKY